MSPRRQSRNTFRLAARTFTGGLSNGRSANYYASFFFSKPNRYPLKSICIEEMWIKTVLKVPLEFCLVRGRRRFRRRSCVLSWRNARFLRRALQRRPTCCRRVKVSSSYLTFIRSLQGVLTKFGIFSRDENREIRRRPFFHQRHYVWQRCVGYYRFWRSLTLTTFKF